MTEDKDAGPDGERESTPMARPAPRRPGEANKEKALGLEVARLFGLNPRLLVKPKVAAEDQEPGEGDGSESAG
jgi:hypothetical protein